MSITSYTTRRIADAVEVTATSDLVGAVVWHWYADGVYVGQTLGPSRQFSIAAGEQCRIEAIDTLDPAFDPFVQAGVAYSPRRSIWWVASLATDIESYRVEQQESGGEWVALGTVFAVAGQWTYCLVSDRLDDLTDYAWRIVPVDQAGNDGTPVSIDEERVVRIPDAPAFEIAYDPETRRVTFSLTG